MRGTATRLALSITLAVSVYAQLKPKDIDGWDKITWGMTMADVRSLYHVDAQPETKDGWILLQLKPVKVAGVSMGVQVGARQAAPKVSSVRLWSFFGVPEAAPGAGADDFDTLRTELIRRYGNPASEQTTHGENFRLLKSVRWTFPSTSILLTLEQSSSIPDIGNIFLQYTSAGN